MSPAARALGRIRRAARSSVVRLVLLVFAGQLVLAGATLLTVRRLTSGELLRTSQARVAELRDELVASWHDGGPPGLETTIDARLRAIGRPDTVILFARPDGTEIAGNLAIWPPTIGPSVGWRTIDLYRVGAETPEHMGVTALVLPDGSRLLAGHVLENDLRFAEVLEEAMLAALLLAVPLALAGALLATRMISARVRRVGDTARAVAAGNLSRRVPADDSGDVFAALGQAVNAMLERIEALVSELRIVTDGLAHDLRSPLTRLKATLDRALAQVAEPGAHAALANALGEADILLAMLATALQISRAEAGIGRDRFATTDLAAMLADIAEMYGPLAEEKGHAIVVSAPAGLTARVHRELLGQAVANLVDNALKYGATCVSLTAETDPRAIRLAVADDGPGIPPERRAEALRRFGRLDAARGAGGAGLGLALVDAVARLHGGTLTLGDADGERRGEEQGDDAPGLYVRLTLPREPGPG